MSREIALTRGMTTFVEDEDFNLVSPYKWWAQRGGGRGERYYACATVSGKTVSMHRFLMGAQKGELIDHEDRDSLNNRRKNLRRATSQQNSRNQGRHRDNRSGYKGIHQRRDGKAWCAQITVDGCNRYLGGFPTPEEAAHAYDAAAKETYGEFAHLNFPD